MANCEVRVRGYKMRGDDGRWTRGCEPTGDRRRGTGREGKYSFFVIRIIFFEERLRAVEGCAAGLRLKVGSCKRLNPSLLSGQAV